MSDPVSFSYPNTKHILKSLSILIVEDEELTLGILSKIISPYVKNVFTAKDGREALHILKKNDIDLLITDYWMPYMDGLELIKEAKAKNSDLPAILITAHSDGINVADAVNFGISRFLTKPVDFKKLTSAIEHSIQNIIIKRLELSNKQKEIELLKYKDKHHQSQENHAYAKQLNIIKNDLSNSSPTDDIIKAKHIFYFHHYYKPFEILSGDCYSMRKLQDNKFFLFILDTMGKGLSASVTAISSTSYINHLINTNQYNRSNSLASLIDKYLYFVKDVLLDDEMICGIFAVFDFDKLIFKFTNFSMPPIFLKKKQNKIIKLNSNEIPITKFTDKFEIKTEELKDIKNILLCSDGLIEAMSNNGDIYLNSIEQDLRNSNYFPELQKHIQGNIQEIPDDTTIFFINKLSIKGFFEKNFTIKSSNSEINFFLTTVYSRMENLNKLKHLAPTISMILNEVLINAHEHGNLGITPETKSKKIFNGDYDNFVAEREKDIDKNISVSFIISITNKELYLIVSDEGKGFSPHIMSKEKPNIENYSGRGLKIIKTLSKDFFLNSEGNQIAVIINLAT